MGQPGPKPHALRSDQKLQARPGLWTTLMRPSGHKHSNPSGTARHTSVVRKHSPGLRSVLRTQKPVLRDRAAVSSRRGAPYPQRALRTTNPGGPYYEPRASVLRAQSARTTSPERPYYKPYFGHEFEIPGNSSIGKEGSPLRAKTINPKKVPGTVYTLSKVFSCLRE